MSSFWLALLVFFLPLQLGRHFWPSYSYVFGLRVDYLSPVIFLQDLLIFPLILLWLKKNYQNLFKAPFVFPTVIFLVFAAINIYFSVSPLLTLLSWGRTAEMVLFVLLVSHDENKVWPYLQKAIPFWLLGEFFLGLWQVLKQSSLGGLTWLLGERSFNFFTPGIAKASWSGKVFLRPYGTFSHPNSLAGFIFVCLILLSIKKKTSVFEKTALFCGLVLLILCFSGTVWLTAFIFSFLLLARQLLIGFKRELKLSLFYLFCLAGVLLSFFLFQNTSFEPASFSQRRELAEVSVQMIQGSPLFGIGANNFILKLSQGDYAWRWLSFLQPVHNIFLLVGSETGLIGLGLFAGFLILTTRRLFHCSIVTLLKKPQKQDNKITSYQFLKLTDNKFVLLVALIAILFTGMFDHYWLTLIQNQLLFAVILGLSWGKGMLK